jgi:hypothetical protein
MWAEDIDDITVAYEEDGVEVVKEEAREVIARGTWPVIVFCYRDWDRTAERHGPRKYTLRKFRKQHGVYKMESKFNIGNPTQAAAISVVLARWASEDADASEGTEVPKVSRKAGKVA